MGFTKYFSKEICGDGQTLFKSGELYFVEKKQLETNFGLNSITLYNNL